jgi:hypothetical protein
MTNNKLKNILKSLDSIAREINTCNDLWSKYFMIVLITVILALDLVLFEAIFVKMSFFFTAIMFYASSVSSSVSFEANKYNKLLNKLFITIDKKQISIFIKIKV